MAVAFIAGSAGSTLSTTTVDTGTFTVASETDKAMSAIVMWSTVSGITVSSVVWDPTGVNQSLTSVAAAVSVGNRRLQAFRLINPSAVTNGIVRVTFSDSAVGTQCIVAAAFSGADQTTPVQDFTTATASSTTVTVTVPNTTNDDMVMDGFMQSGGGGSTEGANQTRIGTEQQPGDLHSGSYQDGNDGGIMSWTLGISGVYLTGGVRIVAATGAHVTLTPPAGSQPHTGRVVSLGIGIGMPSVP